MRRTLVLLLAGALIACAVAGCSDRREEKPEAEESGAEVQATDTDRGTASDAARARGLPAEREQVEGERPAPTLKDVIYEWTLAPEKGLMVALEFGNENEVFERARAYVFLMVEYSERKGVNRGVFPLDAELGEDGPIDYTSGVHIVYRKNHTVRCLIPYTDREGYYDSLRVIVYNEEGDELIDQVYHLEVTGEPTGRVETKPILTL